MIPVMIVPILKGPEVLYRMLDSIDYPIARLIVIDNGDCMHTPADWSVAHVLSTKVIKIPANLGVAGSWNLGIKASPFAPWWLITNFDVVWPAGSLAMFDQQARADALTLGGGFEAWSAFAIGDDVVGRVGLFDEGFHPAYFEDTDYEMRCRLAGVPVRSSTIPVLHHNSSTLGYGDYAHRNASTFQSNSDYFQAGAGMGWSLHRRRENSWD